MNAIETELRNVEWELYLLYRAGVVDVERLEFLWSEVDRLDAALALEE